MKVWPFHGLGVFVLSDGTFPVSGFRWRGAPQVITIMLYSLLVESLLITARNFAAAADKRKPAHRTRI